MCKECIRSRYGIHVFLRNAASPPVKYRGVTAQRFGRVRRLGLRSDPARGRAVLPARLGARPDRGGVAALRSGKSTWVARRMIAKGGFGPLPPGTAHGFPHKSDATAEHGIPSAFSRKPGVISGVWPRCIGFRTGRRSGPRSTRAKGQRIAWAPSRRGQARRTTAG